MRWSDIDKTFLTNYIKKALDDGVEINVALKGAASYLGRTTQATSQYYYTKIRKKGEPNTRNFTAQEERNVILKILMLKAQGYRLTAAARQMAGGDSFRTSRYINKFNNAMRRKPELVRELAEELRNNGVEIPDSILKVRGYNKQN